MRQRGSKWNKQARVCVCVNVVKVKNIFFHDEEIDDEKKVWFYRW
jgi:hypothetical protein